MSFQTSEDLSREESTAARLSRAWDVRMVKLIEMDRIDRFAVRGDRVVAAIEIKVRTHPFGEYPDVFLAFRKHRDLLIASLDRNVRPLFVVSWSCGRIGWVDVREVPMSLVIRGRTDRGANNDLEPVTGVPITMMHKLAA